MAILRRFNLHFVGSCRSGVGTRGYHSSLKRAASVVVGIRREDPERIWERRCPLTPSAVNELVEGGVDVLIQECDRRVWTTDEFVKVTF